MDINIIISGNLTGFTTFYATPNASTIYADAKFDFDYRNYVTFLNNGEKAYAISFAPNVVSVSLITRILDSFRRPGILVVSTLLQRGMIVDSIMNPQNKNVVYQLLNDVNDKFYERNFMNGMLNQNAAVLMQDYYSDILSNYRLTSEYNQRKVNGNIDISTPHKRLGYIAANDVDMPLYLSSLYRRSYEGFHHVFFAANAPQNIEETPEEVAMYRVCITNNRMTLPTMVKLTDQIYRLNPGEGEIPFDQNYTYGEVLEGKAGSQIRASIVGETLEVSYRFKEEEKTINFIFEDRGNIIPLTSIAPVIHDVDGTSYNLSSDTFKFIGKEIYGKKILKSTNTNFIIKPESSTLDLLRLNDGATCHVQVESCSVLDYKFQIPYNVPKTIKIYRKDTNQSDIITDVTDSIYKKIPGSLNEWDYIIESKEYITLKGNLGDLQSIKFSPKPISNASVTTTLPTRGNTQQLVLDCNQPKKGPIKLSDGSDIKKGQSDNRKLNIKKVLLVALPLLVILLYVGISWQLKIWPWDNDSLETKDNQEEEISPTNPEIEPEHPVTKIVNFTFFDAYKNPEKIDKDFINDLIIKEIIKLECKLGNNINEPNTSDLSSFEISANNNNTDIVEMVISINGISITDVSFKKSFDSLAETQNFEISLNVLKSEIDLYVKMSDYINKDNEISYNEWNSLKEKVEDKKSASKNTAFIAYMLDLIKNIKHKEKEDSGKDMSTNIDIKDLDRWDISSEEIEKWENIIEKNPNIGNQEIGGKTKVKARVEALKTVINYIKQGERPSHDHLSEKQRVVIKAIFDAKYNEVDLRTILVNNSTRLKRVSSLKTFKKAIKAISKEYHNCINWPEFTNQ